MSPDDDRPEEHAPADALEVPQVPPRPSRRWLVFLALALILTVGVGTLVISRLGDRDFVTIFRDHPGEMIGKTIAIDHVQVFVIDVRRLDDSSYGVHFVAITDLVNIGEYLHLAPAQNPAPGAPTVAQGDIREVAAGPTNEAWIKVNAGTSTFSIAFVANTGSPAGEVERAPGAPSPDAAAIAARSSSFLGNVTINLIELGISERVWR